MASTLSRAASNLARVPSGNHILKANLSGSTGQSLNRNKKILLTTAGVVVSAAAGLAYQLNDSVKAADLVLHPPSLDWPHKPMLGSYDVKSVRRGYQVYKQVCSACHSLQYVAYREMVNIFMTEEEAKKEAAEILVEDGPNEEGEMFKRPGKLADHIPRPYPNEEAARYANNGAYPPDLTYITLARHGGEDYVFSLLTGYTDPPAGVTLGEGQHFNPYMMGGGIAMAQALYNGTLEYEDGTPPTASQLAKDVCNFLVWASDPYMDERKKRGIKIISLLFITTMAIVSYKKHIWTQIKSRKILFRENSKV